MCLAVIALRLGYLLGSIPFGLILTRLAGTQDLRSIGSGNIGATNVLRTGRKGLAAATLLCDMLKGTVAVIIAGYFGGPDAAMLAALGAFLGHLFPVWLKFKGGKGVATYIGVLLGLFWPAAWCSAWSGSRRGDLALFVAVGADRKRRHADAVLCGSAIPRSPSLFGVLTLLLFYHAPRQHRAAPGRHRRARSEQAKSVPSCQLNNQRMAERHFAASSEPTYVPHRSDCMAVGSPQRFTEKIQWRKLFDMISAFCRPQRQARGAVVC